MSTSNWYPSQCSHNVQFSDDILHSFQSTYNDWAITSLFYSAVHLVNSYCLRHGLAIPKNHDKRSGLVANELQPIWDIYEQLRLLSETTRYTSHHLRITDTDVLCAKQWFQKISTYIDNVG